MRSLGFMFLSLLPATAAAIDFNVTLDTDSEIPAPVLDGATPSGSATVSVNTLTGDVTVAGTYTGLTSNAAAAHIHGLAGPGETAGVLVGLDVEAAMAGSLTGGGTLDAAGLSGLLAGQTYINLHTGNNGPGELRGQVVDSNVAVYAIGLTTEEEVPPPNLGGATPSGSATIVVDKTSGAVEISGQFSGMTSDVTGAHLHGLAAIGDTAGVLVPLDVVGDSFSGAGTLGTDDLAGLLAGQTYINVHTTNNGPGELRGQVVPEPSSSLLMLLGLLLLLRRGRS